MNQQKYFISESAETGKLSQSNNRVRNKRMEGGISVRKTMSLKVDFIYYKLKSYSFIYYVQYYTMDGTILLLKSIDNTGITWKYKKEGTSKSLSILFGNDKKMRRRI